MNNSLLPDEIEVVMEIFVEKGEGEVEGKLRVKQKEVEEATLETVHERKGIRTNNEDEDMIGRWLEAALVRLRRIQ